jgi:hypothetical protein
LSLKKEMPLMSQSLEERRKA